jgi:hypothetical protein
MARFSSGSSEEPGQYPATAWTGFGLPVQDQGTGAAGAPAYSSEVDGGSTNESGQYPAREGFSGVPLGGTGAPGTEGVPGNQENGSGSDSIVWSKPQFYKSEFEGLPQGYAEVTSAATVSGKGDWTQSNTQGYQADAQYQMPGMPASLDAGGAGEYQPGSGRVLYGGWLKGQR